MFSSEQRLTVNGDDYENLKKTLEFAINLNEHDVVSFYKDKKGLIFCDYAVENTIQYPFTSTPTVLAEQIEQYIKSLSYDEICEMAGEAPDNDGDIILGWELFFPSWYGDDEPDRYESQSFLAVRPCWIIYGK